jgi:hypothetical protein
MEDGASAEIVDDRRHFNRVAVGKKRRSSDGHHHGFRLCAVDARNLAVHYSGLARAPQHGVARPYGVQCDDVGAYEFDGDHIFADSAEVKLRCAGAGRATVPNGCRERCQLASRVIKKTSVRVCDSQLLGGKFCGSVS